MLEKFHNLTAAKPVRELNKPPIYALAVSVSGYFQAFIKVGIPAEKSLKIANIIATFASFVIHQNSNAKIEKTPQR